MGAYLPVAAFSVPSSKKIISVRSASISGPNGSLRLISFFVLFEYFVVGNCFSMSLEMIIEMAYEEIVEL